MTYSIEVGNRPSNDTHENRSRLLLLAYAPAVLHRSGDGHGQYALGQAACDQGLLRHGLPAGAVSRRQGHVQFHALAAVAATGNQRRHRPRFFPGAGAKTGGAVAAGGEGFSRPAFLLGQLGDDGPPLPAVPRTLGQTRHGAVRRPSRAGGARLYDSGTARPPSLVQPRLVRVWPSSPLSQTGLASRQEPELHRRRQARGLGAPAAGRPRYRPDVPPPDGARTSRTHNYALLPSDLAAGDRQRTHQARQAGFAAPGQVPRAGRCRGPVAARRRVPPSDVRRRAGRALAV